MTSKQFNLLREGSWFTLWGNIYRIREIGLFTTLAYQMEKTKDDYVEGDLYGFDSDLIKFQAEVYKPYEEETI